MVTSGGDESVDAGGFGHQWGPAEEAEAVLSWCGPGFLARYGDRFATHEVDIAALALLSDRDLLGGDLAVAPSDLPRIREAASDPGGAVSAFVRQQASVRAGFSARHRAFDDLNARRSLRLNNSPIAHSFVAATTTVAPRPTPSNSTLHASDTPRSSSRDALCHGPRHPSMVAADTNAPYRDESPRLSLKNGGGVGGNHHHPFPVGARYCAPVRHVPDQKGLSHPRQPPPVISNPSSAQNDKAIPKPDLSEIFAPTRKSQHLCPIDGKASLLSRSYVCGDAPTVENEACKRQRVGEAPEGVASMSVNHAIAQIRMSENPLDGALPTPPAGGQGGHREGLPTNPQSGSRGHDPLQDAAHTNRGVYEAPTSDVIGCEIIEIDDNDDSLLPPTATAPTVERRPICNGGITENGVRSDKVKSGGGDSLRAVSPHFGEEPISPQTMSHPGGGRRQEPKAERNAFQTLMGASSAIRALSSARGNVAPAADVENFLRGANRGKPSAFKRAPTEGSRPPPWKKVPGTDFVIDGFHHCGPWSRHYFLTHFHADHYTGLDSSFAHGLIFCTPETMRLVKLNLRVPSKSLVALSINKTHHIAGVRVTLVEANHCPGAAIFVFQVGLSTHVHCGDMRFEPSLLSEVIPFGLKGVCIDHLFLDTTYCDPSYAFPPQWSVLRAVAAVVTDEEARASKVPGERVLYVCGSYTIGKEKVWLQVYSALGCSGSIYADTRRRRTLECLDLDRILHCLKDEFCSARRSEQRDSLPAFGSLRRITSGIRIVGDNERSKARIHITNMGTVADGPLSDLLNCTAVKSAGFTRIVAFKPTGWSFQDKKVKEARTQTVLAPRKGGDAAVEEVGGSVRVIGKGGRIKLVSIPYSEHSSVEELRQMVGCLRPMKVLPTVAKSSAHRAEILKLLAATH